MANDTINEVDVLRFFEMESLDKATVLYNIVADKMRMRLSGDQAERPATTSERRRPRAAKVSASLPPEPTSTNE
jgi:hypothetical protein